MNKRITDLHNQAIIFSSKNGGLRISSHIPNDYMEKFAELIIRECALLSDQYQFEKNTSNPLRVKPLPLAPSEFINEHFGVEE